MSCTKLRLCRLKGSWRQGLQGSMCIMCTLCGSRHGLAAHSSCDFPEPVQLHRVRLTRVLDDRTSNALALTAVLDCSLVRLSWLRTDLVGPSLPVVFPRRRASPFQK